MATNQLVNSFPGVAPVKRMVLRGISGGFLATAPVATPGSGYTSVPTVTVTGGTFQAVSSFGVAGVHATIVANLTPVGVNATITVTIGGSGYKSVPSVRFVSVDGNGSGATATAVLTNGVVTSITLGAAGTGYTQPPLVVIEGGDPARRAEATALLAATTVASLTILDPGVGYNAVPTITITGGGGTGATCTTPTRTAQATINSLIVDYCGGDSWNIQIGGRVLRYTGDDPVMNAALKAAFTGTNGFASADRLFGETF